MRTISSIMLLVACASGCGSVDADNVFAADAAAAGSPEADLAMAPDCPTPCSGATPVCAPTRQCVACVTDDNCAAGKVCKSYVCVPGCGDDARCRAGVPGSMSICCGGQCTDGATDVANCGSCGNSCGGLHSSSSCAAGACVPGSCNDGWGDCNQNPADGCESSVRVDVKNCTGCGKPCAIANAIAGCADGCYLAACVFGYDDCNGMIEDGCEASTLSDIGHCGSCSTVCPVPAHGRPVCSTGVCGLKLCDMGWADCDQQPGNGCESNVATDANNCGACGKVCPQGLVCNGGGCTCKQCNIPNASALCINNQCQFDKCNPGFIDCDNNQGNGCEVNSLTDAKNCGGCGAACGQGMSCFNGQCTDVIHGCNGAGQARGCASVANACWCKTGGQFTTGWQVCGYQQGYAGTYYSMNGRDSQNLNVAMDGDQARVILAALGEKPSNTYCAANAQMGSCSQTCSCDCATNILASDNGGSWGTTMSCWTDAQRWDRGTNIVRCTGYEQ